MKQGGATQVHERGDLLGRLHGARLELERTKGLQPSHDAAYEEQRQQEEGPPEERQAQARSTFNRRGHRLQGSRPRDVDAGRDSANQVVPFLCCPRIIVDLPVATRACLISLLLAWCLPRTV